MNKSQTSKFLIDQEKENLPLTHNKLLIHNENV